MFQFNRCTTIIGHCLDGDNVAPTEPTSMLVILLIERYIFELFYIYFLILHRQSSLEIFLFHLLVNQPNK